MFLLWHLTWFEICKISVTYSKCRSLRINLNSDLLRRSSTYQRQTFCNTSKANLELYIEYFEFP